MRPDWAARMYAQFREHRSREFQWGVNDCCLFAARVHDAIHDSAFVDLISTEYHDEESAKAFIALHGSLEAAVAFYLGEPTTERATRGDVVLVDGGMGDALGICNGATVLCMGPRGLRELPRSEIRAVWK